MLNGAKKIAKKNEMPRRNMKKLDPVTEPTGCFKVCFVLTWSSNTRTYVLKNSNFATDTQCLEESSPMPKPANPIPK